MHEEVVSSLLLLMEASYLEEEAASKALHLVLTSPYVKEGQHQLDHEL